MTAGSQHFTPGVAVLEIALAKAGDQKTEVREMI
jgi:hypothetical protein